MHAIIHVFTYKTGLLARLAHDLRLTATSHSLSLQDRHIRATCAASSLRVDGVPTPGGLNTQTLSPSDKQQIEQTIRSEILHSDRHPNVELEGEVSGEPASGKLQVRGMLRLRGQAQSVTVDVVQRGERLEAALELTPTTFGIAPYKALAGAIKLQDRVRVTVDVLLEGQNLEALLRGNAPVNIQSE